MSEYGIEYEVVPLNLLIRNVQHTFHIKLCFNTYILGMKNFIMEQIYLTYNIETQINIYK